MTQQYSPASRNQSDNGTMAGLLRLVLGKFLQGVDDMLPAQVVAYDAASNRAQVQPLIYVVTTDNVQIKRAQVASVPVAQFGGGGFVLRFPIRSGDLGWIKASDRDISLFKRTYKANPPNTQRKHSFEDALFIPDTMLYGVTIAGGDSGNVVLQDYAGDVKISLGAGVVTITAPAVNVNGNMLITGTLTVNGNVTGAGISLNSHHHTGVTPGGGNTGGPV